MRILCLHGMGTNSKVLEMQLCEWYSSIQVVGLRILISLRRHYDINLAIYSRTDTSMLMAESPTRRRRVSLFPTYTCFSKVLTRRLGIEALIGPDEGLAYYDQHSAKSVLTAIDDLSEYIAEEGPFDGILGFSQGASLAAMVMVRACHANPPPFQFAIFFCAGLPYCEKALRTGELKFLRAEDTSGPVIHVPTANIFGAKDPDIAYGKALVDLCQPWGRVVLDHGAGHEIPRVPLEIVDDMARAVEKVITKASIGQ